MWNKPAQSFKRLVGILALVTAKMFCEEAADFNYVTPALELIQKSTDLQAFQKLK